MSNQNHKSEFVRFGKIATLIMVALLVVSVASGWAATITGKCLNGTTPIQEGYVFINGPDGYNAEMEPLADGSYSFNLPKAGDYEIWAIPIAGKCLSIVPTNAATFDGFRYHITMPATGTVTMDFVNKDCGLPPSPSFGDEICDNLGTASNVITYNGYSVDWSSLADKILYIAQGMTLTVPNGQEINLGTKGTLCNAGIIQSTANTSGKAAIRLDIRAAVVQNKGTIQGAKGADGTCGTSAGQGSSISITAKTFNNTNSGTIRSGDGGESPKNAFDETKIDPITGAKIGKGPCPALRCGEGQDTVGGNGGNISIDVVNMDPDNPNRLSANLKNDGLIQTGKGGDAGAAHGKATGGDSGKLRITTPVNDSDAISINNGRLRSGQGGGICAPIDSWQKKRSNPSEPGKGGKVVAFIKEIKGSKIEGTTWGEFYYDPIKLKASGDVQISGFDTVVMYTDEGGEIDFSQLSATASISATKTIQIITKSLNGSGGIVNLRGLNRKLFKASEKIEIFADQVLLDTGLIFKDLADAPVVNVQPGKILYHVSFMSESQFFSEPGTGVTIPVSVYNDGTRTDTYSFTVADSLGWNLGSISDVTVEPRKSVTVQLPVTLSNIRGLINEVRITATSKIDMSVKTTMKVSVEVNAGPDSDGDAYPDSRDAFPNDPKEWLDSDHDGIGNNADLDDDNDGMPDEWELKYEALSPVHDDASEDPDGDGFTNLQEYNAVTNPMDPNSKPRVDVWVSDPSPDDGTEPGKATSIWTSPDVWVRNTDDGKTGYQNVVFGQDNYVYVRVQNRGNLTATDTKVEVYRSGASLGRGWPAGWALVGTAVIESLEAGKSVVTGIRWDKAGIPNPGHYCFYVRLLNDKDPMFSPETNDMVLNTQKNNNVAWRNFNVVGLLNKVTDRFTVKIGNTKNQKVSVDIVFEEKENLLGNEGSRVIIDLGATLFYRWQLSGGKGENIRVLTGTEVQLLATPAKLIGISLEAGEDDLPITMRIDAFKPMPGAGTFRQYQFSTQEFISGELIGGVDYAIITRAQDTDTDNDLIRDVIDDDNDNDLIPDVWEIKHGSNPLVNDASEDVNNNGISNLDEYKASINVADRVDIWVSDPSPDDGSEPGKASNIYFSPSVWVRNTDDGKEGYQNPIYGQDNYVYVRVQNRGNLTATDTAVEVYRSGASLGRGWPNGWEKVGVATIASLESGKSTVAGIRWDKAGIPNPGHYCFYVRLLNDKDPMFSPEGNNMVFNTRQNNNIAWRNFNVVGLLNKVTDRFEVRVGNPTNALVTIELVFDEKDDLLQNDGARVIVDLGATLFQRWQTSGGKGENVKVLSGTEVQLLTTPAKFIGITLNVGEDFPITMRVDAFKPMPGAGTSREYHFSVQEFINSEMIGGVDYIIITRAQDTDSDNDLIKDVIDDDNDNDQIPDDWEIKNGLNPLDSSDALKDDDNDGATNLQEYKANTNPNDPVSKPTGCDYSLTGYVRDYTGLDSCRFIIVTDDGRKFEPASIVPYFQLRAGQRIEFSYKVLTEVMSTCQVGEIVEITCIREVNSPYSSGVFTVDSTGIVKIDWLYDGGRYQGEFGIFDLAGMDAFTPGSPEFIAEAVKRVLSNSELGYLAFSDLSEGARFSGLLGGEIKDWNAGDYKGVKSLAMKPGSQFATVLVPNSTFASLAQNPGTEDPNKRPLFSLVSADPVYGMHIGQMADVNGLGKAYSYEDKNAETSDWDFNDLIVQITGATGNIPSIDELKAQHGRSARQKRDSTDWRTSDLGRLILDHVESPAPTEDTLSMTVTLNLPATLLVYDSAGKVIGKEGGWIAGATFELKADGTQTVTLPMNPGNYRVAVQGTASAQGVLTVKTYQGGTEISADEVSVDIAPRQILTTTVSAEAQPPTVAPLNAAESYDFNGDGVTDNTDVAMLVKHWNSCRGQQKYDAFFDVNDDGCITVADIMTVLNAKTVK